MYKYWILHILLLSIACQTQEKVYDFCEGDGICEAHNIKMEPTVIIPLLEGIMIQPTPDYVNNYEKFPNANCEWPKHMQSNKKARVFICIECNKEYQKWKNLTSK